MLLSAEHSAWNTVNALLFALVAKSCPTLCDPMAPLSRGFPGKNTGLGCRFLLQGIFLTQGLNSRPLLSPALAGGFFTTEPPRKPKCFISVC